MSTLERRLSKLEIIVANEKPAPIVLTQEERDIVLRNSMRQYARENLKDAETLKLFLDVYGVEEECSLDPELCKTCDTLFNDLGISVQEWMYERDDCGIGAAVHEERFMESTTPESRERFKAVIIGPGGITEETPYEHHFSSWESRKRETKP